MKFEHILIDFPWHFKTYSDKGRGRSPKYTTLTIDKLKKLPLKDIMAKNCAVTSWVTDPFLMESKDLLASFGLKYSTVLFYWVKTTADGEELIMGNGYHTRANPEQLHLWYRGRAPKRGEFAKDIIKVIMSPRLKPHSRKPMEIYPKITKLWPRIQGHCELFATQKVPGYISLGYDVDGMDIFESLPLLAAATDEQHYKKLLEDHASL